MESIKDALESETRELDEILKFQIERFGFFLLDDAEFDDVFERSLCEYDFKSDSASIRDFAHRLICLTIRQTHIANTSKSKSEVLHAICEGINLVGTLRGIDDEICEQYTCTSCAIKNHQSDNGTKGAEKRHAPMRELAKWTVEQRTIGDTRTANKAAHEMKADVIQYGKTIGATLSEENAQRTIAEWLRKPKKLSV